MTFINGLIIGGFVGVIFSQLILKLFNVGWTKLDKDIDRLKK